MRKSDNARDFGAEFIVPVFAVDSTMHYRSLLTFRSRYNTSSVLQLEISSRASLRDNFLNIAPCVHAAVTKKKILARVHRPVASASAFCGRGVLTVLSPRRFVFSSLPLCILTSVVGRHSNAYMTKRPSSTTIGHFLMVHLFH